MKKCSCGCDENVDKEVMQKMWRHGHHHYGHKNGPVYGLGFIGAAIYFVGKATTFGTGVVGFLKAIIWPSYLVYESLKFLIK